VLIDFGIGVFASPDHQTLAVWRDPITQLGPPRIWPLRHTSGQRIGCRPLAQKIMPKRTLTSICPSPRVEEWDYNFSSLAPVGIPARCFAARTQLNLNSPPYGLKRLYARATPIATSPSLCRPTSLHAGETYWNGHLSFSSTMPRVAASTEWTSASDAHLAVTTN